MQSEGAALDAKLIAPMEVWLSSHEAWADGFQGHGTWGISVFSAEVAIFSAHFSLLDVLNESLDYAAQEHPERLAQLRADLLKAAEVVGARIAALEG